MFASGTGLVPSSSGGRRGLTANVFPGGQLNVEVNMGSGPTSRRYIHDGLVLIPRDDRLIVGVQTASLAFLQRAEEVGSRILQLLPHTPMTACGVNASYESQTPGDLARLFESRREFLLDQPIGQSMTRDPQRVTLGTPLDQAIEALRARKLSELPVVDRSGNLVGLIDITDLIGIDADED